MLKSLQRPPELETAPPKLGRLFQTKQTELVPGTAKYWVRVLLAPTCLLLVAGLHGYRVVAHDQTQWKGGGFAMFTTVDSPAARTMRFYLLTEEGETAVEPPKRMEKWIGEMRAAPNAETMQIIAQRMQEITWVRSGHQWRTAAARLGDGERAADREGSDGESLSVVSLSIGEPLPPEREIVKPEGVRIELWRYRFDAKTSRLINEKAMELVSKEKSP